MNQIIAFVAPDGSSPLQVPVSLENPLPVYAVGGTPGGGVASILAGANIAVDTPTGVVTVSLKNFLTLSGQSLTGSQATSLLDLAATWNTSGAPTALKLNVTNTASDAASLLMDLQVGGVSKNQIDKLGRQRFGSDGNGYNPYLFLSAAATYGFSPYSTAGFCWANGGAISMSYYAGVGGGMVLSKDSYYTFSSGADGAPGSEDTKIKRAAAAVVEVESAIKTGDPAGGTAAAWKMGDYSAGAPTATGKLLVQVGAATYEIAARLVP